MTTPKTPLRERANYDLFVGNVRSALGDYYDAEAGLVCSIALLAAEHDALRKRSALTAPASPPALEGMGAVAWLIEWYEPSPYHGKRTVSFDKCHPDDGTCRPLIYGDTRPVAAQQAVTDEIVDPHHTESVRWRWDNGRLYQRVVGQSKWVECKKVHATPQRICALAVALAQPPEAQEGEAAPPIPAFPDRSWRQDE